MRRFLEESGITPQQIPLKILLPAVEYASVEDDDDLHTMWAALLTSAADPAKDEVLPSFLDVLRQLSKQEAQFLLGLYKVSVEWSQVNVGLPCKMDIDKLQSIYLEDVTERRTDYQTFQLFVDDLMRMRLLAETTTTVIPNAMQEYSRSTPLMSVRGIHMTDYGIRFVAACYRSNR